MANKFYTAALEELKSARKHALALHQQQKEELYSKEPRLTNIDLQLNSIGAQLAITALSGNTAKLEQLKEQSLALTKEKETLLAAANLKEPAPLCAACKDTGYIQGKYCDCVKHRAKALMAQELGREMPIEQCTFASFELRFYPESAKKRMEQIFNFCRGYAEGFGKKSKNLLFTGGAGLGKTHLSLAIVGEVAAAGYDVIYSPAQRLFDTIEKEHFAYSGSEDLLEAALSCDLLVIDDLGTEFSTSFTASVIHNIIDTRLLRGKATIISTNLDPVELEKKYDARILSRLMGSYEFKVFQGVDIRQQKAMAK